MASEPESPRIQKTTGLIEDNRKVAVYAQVNGLTWAEAPKQRRRDQCLAERRAKEAMQADAAPTPHLRLTAQTSPHMKPSARSDAPSEPAGSGEPRKIPRTARSLS